MFIGRKKELSMILSQLNHEGLRAVLVYGRRRVGKTELIKEAIKQSNLPALNLLARNVDSKLNLEDFSKEASKFMNVIGYRASDFYELFASLIEYSKNKSFILFIDEYSYLKEDDDSIDSYLQKAIELHKDGASIKIILCGSYVDIMSRMIDYDAPLYGRFNQIILLRPFDYLESGEFFADASPIDKFQYYAIFGGIAFNLTCLDKRKTFEENIIESFISPNSFFENEAVLLVQREIKKDNRLNTIFDLITRGYKTYRELNSYLGDEKKDNCTRYLKILENMDLIDKSFSITDNKRAKPIYKIKDKMLNFYYTFLFRNQFLRSLMSPETFYNDVVRTKLFLDYLPHKFEDVVKEYCIRENGKSLPLFTGASNLTFNGKIDGKQINREFDLVLKTDRGLIPIECKYKDTQVTMSDVYEEMNQWQGLPFTIYKFGFASKSGFDDKVKDNKDLLLLSLDDIYK